MRADCATIAKGDTKEAQTITSVACPGPQRLVVEEIKLKPENPRR